MTSVAYQIPSLLTPEMVDIYVGPKRKRFHIYRQLICSKASFFNSHFGPIETKQPMTDMYLPDHDPRAFDLFSTFLFQNSFAEIIPPIEGAENQSKTMLDRYATDIDTFLQLYLMARDWHIRNLRNQVLDHLHRYIAKSGASFRPIQVATVWGKIKDPASLLKRFIVDHFVFSVMKKSVSSKVRRSHLINRMNIDSSTFVLDVFDAIIGARKYPTPIDPDTKDLCDYHEHPKGEQCPE